MMNKVFLAALTTLALATGVRAQILYANDFEATEGGFTSGARVSHPNTADPSGATSQFLGLFSDNAATTLTLAGLVPGSLYNLTLDLLVKGSWDGNTAVVGPDLWRVRADGGVLVETTFSNVSGSNQSFAPGNRIAPGDSAPGTGAEFSNADIFGIFDGYSLYKFDAVSNPQIEFTAVGDTVVLTFEGQNLQGVSDESWALDNVVVTGPGNAVPEPGTLLLAGLGTLALLRRRR